MFTTTPLNILTKKSLDEKHFCCSDLGDDWPTWCSSLGMVQLFGNFHYHQYHHHQLLQYYHHHHHQDLQIIVISTSHVPTISHLTTINMIVETTLIQGCKPESVTDLVNNKQKYSAVSINRSSHIITSKKYCKIRNQL